jgi:thiamine biosynthesis lipoprotein
MVWEQTGGAFDVTIGPLFRLLREQAAGQRQVTKSERQTAAASIGYQHLELNEENLTVTKHADAMSLDLGAIGKGYALDQAAFLMKGEYGITNALLNAGDSTVLGIGKMPPQHAGWPVRAGAGAPVLLKDNALSGTGFLHQGAHIIDPRTAKTVSLERHLRWAIAPNATLADALSTAFMVMNLKEIDACCKQQPEVSVVFC